MEAESGCISIDGVDIADLPLDSLRQNLSLIPQDPVLFTGTIRSNCDPFGLYDDAEIWKSLKSVEMADSITSLDEAVASGGENFSAGQRGALVRRVLYCGKVKLLSLTKNHGVGRSTDRSGPSADDSKEFKEMTVLSIAHRLDTDSSSRQDCRTRCKGAR